MPSLSTALKVAGVALLATGTLLGAGVAAGVLGVPSAGLVDRGDWATVTDDRITIRSTYYVHNPNPVGLSSNGTEIEFALRLNGVSLANGTKRGIAVESGNQTGNVTTTLRQQRIPEWFRRHVADGERSVAAVSVNASVPIFGHRFEGSTPPIERNVSTNVSGAVASSVAQYEGEYPTGVPVIEVRDTAVAWGNVTEDETPLAVTFVVHNPNPTVLPVPAFAGDLEGNDVTLAKWNASEVQMTEAPDDGTIGPGETERITFTANLRNENLDEWLTSHVRRVEYTDITMTGALAVTYQGATYTIPSEGGLRCRSHVQTTILVDNRTAETDTDGCEPATGDVGQRARSGSTSDGSGDDSDGSTPTPTPAGTDTSGSSSGATATPTDDTLLDV